MVFYFLFILTCVCGFVLFAKIRLVAGETPPGRPYRVSVIIPARNEEKNLPHILGSLRAQTCAPHEIIVVDDFSSDGTGRIAGAYDGVTVIRNSELPEGWTGKTWAVWNGYLRATGDLLVFLDADVRLAPRGLERLIVTRERCGGVISAVPYHHTEKFYERFSLIPCLLGVFAFTSPFERRGARSLYGSCVVALREDYERINGHSGIRSELLDDLNLGKKFAGAGVPVHNFLGCGLVSFRMYPYGIANEINGFAKGAVLSTATLRPATVLLIACWLAGLLAAQFALPVLLAFRHPWAWPFLAGYGMYTVQMAYFNRYTGRYGVTVPLLHALSSLFFIIVMLYSVYQVVFLGSVSWKGRKVRVGDGK